MTDDTLADFADFATAELRSENAVLREKVAKAEAACAATTSFIQHEFCLDPEMSKEDCDIIGNQLRVWTKEERLLVINILRKSTTIPGQRLLDELEQLRGCLSDIEALAFDYDGYGTVVGLKSLTDELAALARSRKPLPIEPPGSQKGTKP